MSAVRVAGARKAYPGRPPVVALDSVDLSISAGTLAVVLGESGSGKTTLLRAIAGFERLDDGTIELGDRIVSSRAGHVPPERRRVGIVPQDGSLFPHLTVAANVAYGLKRGRRSGTDQRVTDLLEMVGLGGYGGRYPHQLSGGQQQRVAVARALAPQPEVVLLDEPFAALDATLRGRLRNDVAAALRAAGATALVVTHDPVEAMALADQLAVMRDGRVVQAGTARDVYLHPVDAAAARALGDVVALTGTASGGVAHTALGPVAVGAAGGAVDLLVRPEQIVPVADRTGASVIVAAVELQGHDVLVDLVTGAGSSNPTVVRALWPASAEPRPGACVDVAIAGHALVVAPGHATDAASTRSPAEHTPITLVADVPSVA